MENLNDQNMIITAPNGMNMSDMVFDALRHMIYDECGITLSENKKILLSTRLYKRLKSLKLKCFKDYYQYLNSPDGKKSELELMINEITTNKTEFFREPEHFDILANRVLPELSKKFSDFSLNIWSAGCSTGEEPYSLAMVLMNYFSKNYGDFSLFATDICTSVLEMAKRAIYLEKDMETMPSGVKFKYFMHGKGDNKGLHKVVPEIRSRVEFAKLNLNDRDFGIKKKMHVIFCRNVIIYFNREKQVELFKKFYDQLVPGGYMFIGHSETLNRVNKNFEFIAPSVYQKPE